MAILKKQSVPLIGLIGLFVVVATFGDVATSARVPLRDYQGYVWCNYGSTGTSVLAAATFYVAMIAAWALADLYYLKKRVSYTKREPFYHDERIDMTLAMLWVLGICSGGFFMGLIFNLPSEIIQDALSVKFIFVTGAITAASIGGLFLIMWPKYRNIYVHPDRNIIFQGERFSVPVTEGGVENLIEPTIDPNDMDPRLLRKNVELLKENLVYAEKLGETKEELGRVHTLLIAYERSARAVTPALRPLTRENVSSAYVGVGAEGGEGLGGDGGGGTQGDGIMSELGSVSNPSLPPYDDEYYDDDDEYYDEEGMEGIPEEGEEGGEGEERDTVGLLLPSPHGGNHTPISPRSMVSKVSTEIDWEKGELETVDDEEKEEGEEDEEDEEDTGRTEDGGRGGCRSHTVSRSRGRLSFQAVSFSLLQMVMCSGENGFSTLFPSSSKDSVSPAPQMLGVIGCTPRPTLS